MNVWTKLRYDFPHAPSPEQERLIVGANHKKANDYFFWRDKKPYSKYLLSHTRICVFNYMLSRFCQYLHAWPSTT